MLASFFEEIIRQYLIDNGGSMLEDMAGELAEEIADALSMEVDRINTFIAFMDGKEVKGSK